MMGQILEETSAFIYFSHAWKSHLYIYKLHLSISRLLKVYCFSFAAGLIYAFSQELQSMNIVPRLKLAEA